MKILKNILTLLCFNTILLSHAFAQNVSATHIFTSSDDRKIFDTFFEDFNKALTNGNQNWIQNSCENEFYIANCFSKNIQKTSPADDFQIIYNELRIFADELILKKYSATSWGFDSGKILIENCSNDELLKRYNDLNLKFFDTSIFKITIDSQYSLYFYKTNNSFELFATYHCPKPQK